MIARGVRSGADRVVSSYSKLHKICRGLGNADSLVSKLFPECCHAFATLVEDLGVGAEHSRDSWLCWSATVFDCRSVNPCEGDGGSFHA